MSRHGLLLLGCLLLPKLVEVRLTVLANDTLQLNNRGRQVLLNAVDITLRIQETTSRMAALDATVSRQTTIIDRLVEAVGLLKLKLLGSTGIVQFKRLTASDALAGNRFGSTVAIANDTIVIGADAGSKAYLSRVFLGVDGLWDVTAPQLFQPAGAASNYNRFGTSVALSPDAETVIVGAPASMKV
jgi:hypothetical protein